jgi:2-oxoglutarate dehydrogenase E2 component (dihydrolipoamide succinyltransferase)
MAFELRVPELGESVVEATVAEWLKAEGDAVQVGEAVVRLETDKIDVEVSAEQAGRACADPAAKRRDAYAGETFCRIEPAGESCCTGAGTATR